MEIINYISGPFIGGIIGYFTNFIAVKMLFYPRKEIRFFGHVLPFTPGAIPKGQSRLAAAVGSAVSGSLLTKKEIEAILLSDEVKNHVTDALMKHLRVSINREICILTDLSEEEYNIKKYELSNAVSQEIIDSVDVDSLMNDIGIEYIKERLHGKTLGRLISDEWITSAAKYIAKEMQTVVNDKGVLYVKPIVDNKLNSIDSCSVEDLFKQSGREPEEVRNAIMEGYERLVTDNLDRSMSHIDIASVIEDKINGMPVDELERLLMTVMKNELNTIVNLGAIIGIILGLLNNLL
jgi:uncharacterized membrane protein YheB (UPF0754 family)